MNPLTELRAQNIAIMLDGTNLRFYNPQGITQEQKEAIRRDKAELIRLLQAEQSSSPAAVGGGGADEEASPLAGYYNLAPTLAEELHGTITTEEGELCLSVKNQIETGRLPAHLWPGINGYLKRQLHPRLFAALEALVQARGELPREQRAPAEEWQSPFPAKCFNCARQRGCSRPELAQWGLFCRHDCPVFTPSK